jgi:hypothetical protein
MAIQPAATLSAIPEFPALADRAAGVYNSKAYAFGAHMGTPGPFVGQINALAANVNNNAQETFALSQLAEAAKIAATTQADAAMGYRNAAQASATAASGSATLAGTHASNSAASYAAMQKLYLGAKTSNPTTDNQGNALQVGAWYTYIGTDPAYKGVWLWWDGATWNPGIGPVAATLMPKTGGVFSGHTSGPSGATGAQHPQAQETLLKVPEVWGKTKLMGDLQVGFAQLTTTTGRGGDWPAETYDASIQCWHVETTGSVGRAKQVATQVFASDGQRIQGSTWQRVLHDTTWQAWDRVITARTAMDQQITVNVPAGTTTYSLDSSPGASHVVTINGSCTFNLPAGRQYGDQIVLDVVSQGGVRSIGFSSNVRLPIDGTGALIPFPTYVAGSVISFVFRCILVNRWECYYAGVH